MNKQSLLEKRYIVRILTLILEKGENDEFKSNKEIAERLNISASSIHKQLSYLEKQGIIYKEKDEKSNYNRKVYICEGKKLAELFLKFVMKEKNILGILRYKNNEWIKGLICLLIFSQINNKDAEKITLKDIFLKTYDSLLTGYYEGEGKRYLFKFTANEKILEKTKSEFNKFVKILKDNLIDKKELNQL